ncbi:Lag2p SKDI_15G1310 [Saccharomyces kudriavzevii IFO 1802]|uniref:LAG2-like protein n=2 Tax=Saccharomyces kudriavzevii (strain ATCC MYA-4449 / AS 2.2408 / CBS 8840 / NBRC 1802 / NCYC 2889) TaxID=226230 RepID=J6EGA4_SACK1|nr:uncharacterized protein SKDI_15G1310 [Saccharomyces kudriavzevii IFO 1802]EJT43079.1 LAG2-like protein [Saccharomyces kudriavzevii IFO 1802]CAI4051071.1 hypothetical protein SKDI_15G1310 [Saccharomyces kudriavzevii IFO 1802]
MSLPISNLIEKYRSTKDNDLKYMLLRQNFEINDIENELIPLINYLLLPILVEEQDMEILNLVSFQVFPNLVLTLIRDNATAAHLGWVTSLVWEPLLDQSMIYANRSFVLIETLRNILQRIENVPRSYCCQPAGNAFGFISKFIVEMKRHMLEIGAAQFSHSLHESNMLIYIESLDLLLKFNLFSNATCPSLLVTLPFDILSDIFTIAQNYSATNTNESIDRITEKLLLTSAQLTHPIDLENLCPKINDNTLSIVSRIWYKFGPMANGIFTERLLPVILSPPQSEGECSIETVLEIIYNFHPFFSFLTLKDNRPLLSDSIINRLRTGLFSMLRTLNLSLSRAHNGKSGDGRQPIDSDDGFDSDNDPEQQAYLDELISDNDDEHMYGSDTDDEKADDINVEKNDETAKDISETNKILFIFAELHYPHKEHFSELLTELQTKIAIDSSLIDKILSQDAIEFSTPCGKLIDLNEILSEVKANKLARKDDIIYTLTHSLSLQAYSDLSVLQLSIEVVDQLLVKNHSNNISRDEQFQLIKLILPHLKTNKSFIDTLKAGNFTQKIDEGVTLRTMILSLLLQLLPLDYSMLGEILPTIAKYSVRDKDLTVRDLSLQLSHQILDTYYNHLIGVDWDWYNDDFYQVLKETCTKKDIDTDLLQQFPPYSPHK